MRKFSFRTTLMVCGLMGNLLLSDACFAQCARRGRRLCSRRVDVQCVPREQAPQPSYSLREVSPATTVLQHEQPPETDDQPEELSGELVGKIVIVPGRGGDKVKGEQVEPNRQEKRELAGASGVFIIAIPSKKAAISIREAPIPDPLEFSLTNGVIHPSRAVAHEGQSIRFRNNDDDDLLIVYPGRGGDFDLQAPHNVSIDIPALPSMLLPYELVAFEANATAQLIVETGTLRAAVTDESGRFRLSGLTPGNWRFMIWHGTKVISEFIPTQATARSERRTFYVHIKPGVTTFPTIAISETRFRDQN